MVTCMDQAVGDIVNSLEENNFPMDNTLIFFCSDNGGIRRFGSNGEFRGEKGKLYEGGIRVPAIMVLDGRIPAGRAVDQPMHIVDLYPTLLALAGIDVNQPKPVDGLDVLPVITNENPIEREFILHNVTPFGGALRMGDWKIVHNGQSAANDTSGPQEERWELFNLAVDPNEQRDRLQEEPEIAARLRAKLEELRDAAAEPNISPNQAPADFKVPAVWGESP
jgi:arylsulfatase A-like enzyme